MRLAIEQMTDGAWVITRVGGIGRLAGATIDQIMRMREVDADEVLAAAVATRRKLSIGGAQLTVEVDEVRGVARLAPPPRPTLFVPQRAGEDGASC